MPLQPDGSLYKFFMHFLYKLYVQNNPMLLRDHNDFTWRQSRIQQFVTAVLLACVLGDRLHGPFFRRADPRRGKERKYACHAIHCEVYTARRDCPRSGPVTACAVVNSTAHLAIGVVRITTALASSAGRRNTEPSVDRLQVVEARHGRPQNSISQPASLSLGLNLSRIGEARICET